MRNFPVLFIVWCLTACGSSETPDLGGFEQMEGTWVSEADGKIFSEHWEKSGERMSGQGYLIQGKDTLFGEKLVVEKINDRLVYIADVPGQDLVLFTRKGTGKSFRFENAEHDFPKVVLYEPQQDDQTVRVMLEGKEKDSIIRETFIFKRQQP